MLIRRRPFLASLLATPALLRPAYAQASFPDRPLRLVVPYPPGGGTDAFARRFAIRLGQELGQTIVVENRTGAAGAIGVQEALRSRADGYTLAFGGASTHALYPLVFARPQYDPIQDFTQVALLGANTVCFIARKGVADNLGDILAQARRKPGELRFGSPGAGTYVHLAGEYLLHAAGGVQMLAVASLKRSPLAPDVPTVAGAIGLPSFEAELWSLIAVRRGTPTEFVIILNAASIKALTAPDFMAELRAAGVTPAAPMTPAQVADYVRAEQEKWRPVVRMTGVWIE